MSPDKKQRAGWQRKVALLVVASATLAALIALRGPDPIAAQTVNATGAWMLSGPAVWDANTAFGVLARPTYALAGPRGWQNLHVIAAWLAVLCSLLPLPAPAWRGLTPLIPVLLAAVLSVPSSGFTGFGIAVLALCAWRSLAFNRPDSARTFPAVAWLAGWLSPGALPVVAAFAIESGTRWKQTQFMLATIAAAIAVNLTPRGFSVWTDLWIFLRWSPSTPPDAAGTIALLLNVPVLALALRWSLAQKSAGTAIAPVFLLLICSYGQTAYLWPAALLTIPLWTAAKEQLRALGVNVRWWAGTALVCMAIALTVWEGLCRTNDWYNLAMVREAAQPTLTRETLPREGPIYINPQGLPMARFVGGLPERAKEGEQAGMARDPRLWRAQDRRFRYHAVWLLGQKSDYAPLARHLGESPDWRLAAVDATGLVFLREPKTEEFATEQVQGLSRGLVGGANRAALLSGAALSCLAAQAFSEADEFSRSAVRKSDLSSDTATARSLVLISLGQIDAALEQSALAVRLTPDASAAWQARAECLLHAGRADDAYAAAQRAADLAPGDEGALWLAARAANAARAFQSESEILEQLIQLSEGRGGDAGFYELYLGQSYAKQGLARPALRALEKAAAAPGLTDEQRAEMQEEIARVRESASRN